MHSQVPAVPRLKSPKPSRQANLWGTSRYEPGTNAHVGRNIWARASAMAADRSDTATGRHLRTYLYASVLFVVTAAVLVLALFGGSLLFVVGVFEIARRRASSFAARRLRAGPRGDRRGLGIRHWLRRLALQCAARLR
jgi:hypothetical protein